MTISNPKFKDKYRIASNRLQGWDYGTPGYYFVTICSQNRVPWFGEVKSDHMILSPVGEIVAEGLEKISKIHPNINLEARVVMPNHIHVIIVINELPQSKDEKLGIEASTPYIGVETPQWDVSTARNWRPGILGAIINQYKAVCTKRIRAKGYVDFAWQARFYDHIIQNEKSLENICTYILGNPIKWTEDEYFSEL
jgi:putative transposase